MAWCSWQSYCTSAHDAGTMMLDSSHERDLDFKHITLGFSSQRSKSSGRNIDVGRVFDFRILFVLLPSRSLLCRSCSHLCRWLAIPHCDEGVRCFLTNGGGEKETCVLKAGVTTPMGVMMFMVLCAEKWTHSVIVHWMRTPKCFWNSRRAVEKNASRAWIFQFASN